MTAPAFIAVPLRIVAIIWASPYTLLGLLIGFVGVFTGGHARIRGRVIEFYGRGVKWFWHRFPHGQFTRAFTLGHTVLGQTDAAHDVCRDHELVHVRQLERWGAADGACLPGLLSGTLADAPQTVPRQSVRTVGIREGRWGIMNRTVRLASLLRWTLVAMHTALVVSLLLAIPAISVSRRLEWIVTRGDGAWLVLADLPVSILSVPFIASGMVESSPGAVVVAAMYALLGGLQWYLIGGLLARMTCGLQRTVPVVSRRFGLMLLAGFVLTLGCAVLPWRSQLQRLLHPYTPYTPPVVAFNGESKDLGQSVVVPTLDTPMPSDKNVIWCGTLQLAWNHLANDVLHEPPSIQGAEILVSRLNQAQFGENDLPRDSYLATAGFARDGVVEQVRSEMKRKFHKEVDIDPLAPNDILAYAYLEANSAFTVPFFDNREQFHFRGSEGVRTNVSSFGVEEKREYAYEALREQIDVLYLVRKKADPEELEEFVIDLCRNSSPNQIIVACIPPKATLLETLDDVERKTQEFARQPNAQHGRRFGTRDVLLVPNLNWDIRHRFAELEGDDKRFLNRGFSGYYIAKAMQTIRFRLDRSGAELASEVQMPCRPMATHFVCDRPFLIVAKKRGSERPFFVMWVDNAELLSKFPEDQPQEASP